jgi:hypothetical protein
MWELATDTSWALHRAHIRAGRYIALHGPDPTEIYLPAEWAEIKEALESELRYVEDHLDQYPDYCILQLCRLIYSYHTKDVVTSKAQAAVWAITALPDWRQLVELARESYPGQATPTARQSMVAQIKPFLEFARIRMHQE